MYKVIKRKSLYGTSTWYIVPSYINEKELSDEELYDVSYTLMNNRVRAENFCVSLNSFNHG